MGRYYFYFFRRYKAYIERRLSKAMFIIVSVILFIFLSASICAVCYIFYDLLCNCFGMNGMFKQLSVPLFRKTTKLPQHKELSFDSQEIYDIFVGVLKGDREWADRVTEGKYKKKISEENKFFNECASLSAKQIESEFYYLQCNGTQGFQTSRAVEHIVGYRYPMRNRFRTIGECIYDYINNGNTTTKHRFTEDLGIPPNLPGKIIDVKHDAYTRSIEVTCTDNP